MVEDGTAGAKSGLPPSRKPLYYLRRPMDRFKRRLILTFAALVLVIGIGTTGFILIEHWPFFDAFYMTLITMTTVGYSEIHPLTHAGRVFNSFLIVIGVSMIFMAI